MKWHNLPAELRALPQWVIAGPDRVPRTPKSGVASSPVDSKTWGTFEDATKSGYMHIGFVFSNNDPYAVIDLDNKIDNPATEQDLARHQLILDHFESYTERSTSGRGFHIIVKGSVPSGVNRDHTEVYSWGRYMICTGDVVRLAPIKDYQESLTKMYGEMKPFEISTLVELDEILTDKDLVEMAMGATNADKFNRLCNGLWQSEYTSQSEADFALLAMFAFYSPSNDQVRRLFRMSRLGERQKAVRDDKYLNIALAKVRTKHPGPLDLSKLLLRPATVAEPIKEPPKVSIGQHLTANPNPPKKMKGLTLPPGLIGEMAHYFYQTSIRPVPDISLAASIALAAGICGRSYNISGTGLNQYLILVARTGAGKEGAGKAIDQLVASVRPQIPMIDEFMGPSAFASGQALIKVLNDRPCFVSVLGEFGLTLQQICDSNANSAQVMLRKVLLDLYQKSGFQQVLRPSVYSDIEKNTNLVQSPNVTIFGETTPETFFDGLDSSHIADGLIPRFSIIQYTGNRPARNKNAGVPPPQQLINKFSDFALVALTTRQNNTCKVVLVAPDAQKMLDEFDVYCDGEINGSNQDIEKQVWNRAHLKALKLSALLAVGVNIHDPVVTTDLAQWSINFVTEDVTNLANKFKTGDVGRGDAKISSDLKDVILGYFDSSYEKVKSYGVEFKMFQDHVIPYCYLMRKTANLSAYRTDKRGSTNALKTGLQDLCDSNMLIELPAQQLLGSFGSRGKAWVLGPAWHVK